MTYLAPEEIHSPCATLYAFFPESDSGLLPSKRKQKLKKNKQKNKCCKSKNTWKIRVFKMKSQCSWCTRDILVRVMQGWAVVLTVSNRCHAAVSATHRGLDRLPVGSQVAPSLTHSLTWTLLQTQSLFCGRSFHLWFDYVCLCRYLLIIYHSVLTSAEYQATCYWV